MKKIIFLLVIIAVSLGACNYFEKSEKKSKVETTEISPCENEVNNLKSALKASETQVTELRIDTAELNAEIRCLKRLYGDCIDCKEVKKEPEKKSTTKTTYRKPVKKSTSSQVTIVEPEVTETRVVKNTSTGTPNLSYLREGGEIIFCARANRREDCYFPHYAIQNGITFSNFQNNQLKGYNWKVEPSDGYQGDYGVTKHGTFYVSNSLIQKALQKGGLSLQGALQIKCPYTGWIAKDMTQEGSFWIYKTQK